MFGSENWVSLITFRKTAGATSEFLPNTADYLLWYARDKTQLAFNRLYLKQDVSDDFHWNLAEDKSGARYRHEGKLDSDSQQIRLVSLWPPTFSPNAVFDVPFAGKQWPPAPGQ